MSLAQRLTDAADDRQRLAVLETADPAALQALHDELLYRQWIIEAEAAVSAQQARFDSFAAALEAAESDAERERIISEHDAEFLAAWAFDRTADGSAWAKRYMEYVSRPA